MNVCKVSCIAQVPAKIPMAGNLDVRQATRLLLLHYANWQRCVSCESRVEGMYKLASLRLFFAICSAHPKGVIKLRVLTSTRAAHRVANHLCRPPRRRLQGRPRLPRPPTPFYGPRTHPRAGAA